MDMQLSRAEFVDGLTAALVAVDSPRGQIPALQCVQIAITNTGTIRLNSTDRFRLVHIEYNLSEFPTLQDVGTWLLHRDDVKRILATFKVTKANKNSLIAVTRDDDTGALSFRDMSDPYASGLQVMPRIADFPNLSQVIPTEFTDTPAPLYGLNPTILAGVDKMPLLKDAPVRMQFAALGGHRSGQASRPLMFTGTAPSGIEWLYLMMPIRLQD